MTQDSSVVLLNHPVADTFLWLFLDLSNDPWATFLFARQVFRCWSVITASHHGADSGEEGPADVGY